MKLSIIIPTYNGSKYIRAAINSVLNQTHKPYEIIISDDNSSDDTLKICREFEDQIKIYRNQQGPSGFVNGWNNAISHANGDYISILHQDDLLAPTFIEELEKAITTYPDVKHFFTPCNYINADGMVTRPSSKVCDGSTYRYTGQEYINAYILIKNHIHRCPGVVTHKDIFKVCNYREEAGHIADDDFFMRVGYYTDVVGILKPLASYREHNESETGHLSLLSINQRLLKDYHFQLEHRNENPLLTSEIINIFRERETQYIHRVIIYGFKLKKIKYIILGIKYWMYYDKDEKFRNLNFDFQRLKKKLKLFLKSK